MFPYCRSTAMWETQPDIRAGRLTFPFRFSLFRPVPFSAAPLPLLPPFLFRSCSWLSREYSTVLFCLTKLHPNFPLYSTLRSAFRLPIWSPWNPLLLGILLTAALYSVVSSALLLWSSILQPPPFLVSWPHRRRRRRLPPPPMLAANLLSDTASFPAPSAQLPSFESFTSLCACGMRTLNFKVPSPTAAKKVVPTWIRLLV